MSLIADEDADTHYFMQARAIARWYYGGYLVRCNKHVADATMGAHVYTGVGAVEVETAPGQVLGARIIGQAMAYSKLYAQGRWSLLCAISCCLLLLLLLLV